MKVFLYLMLITFLSVSCSSLSNLSNSTYPITHLNKENFQNLNGIYENYQDTVFGKITHHPGRGFNENNISLLNRLFIFIPNEAYNEKTAIEIKFVTNRKAEINTYLDDSLITSRKIRGRFKQGYFYTRPKILIIPFFPVLYVHDFERVRIGKTESNLIIDHSIRSWGFALFAGGSDLGSNTSIYKIKKK